MNGVKSNYKCTAANKKGCRFWELLIRKERCKGCEVYEHGDYGVDECYACNSYLPRCEYDEQGDCTYTLAIVNRVILDCKAMGLELIQKPKGE